jgi:hypothetical protein
MGSTCITEVENLEDSEIKRLKREVLGDENNE